MVPGVASLCLRPLRLRPRPRHLLHSDNDAVGGSSPCERDGGRIHDGDNTQRSPPARSGGERKDEEEEERDEKHAKVMLPTISNYTPFMTPRTPRMPSNKQDHGRTVWVEISRMPPKYFRALLRLSAERFECFGQDNLICFTSWNQGRGLLYDVDKKAWSWIAGCASQLCNTQFCFYEPRFDTSIY